MISAKVTGMLQNFNFIDATLYKTFVAELFQGTNFSRSCVFYEFFSLLVNEQFLPHHPNRKRVYYVMRQYMVY